MDWNGFSPVHRTLQKSPDNMSEIMTTHDTYLSDLTPAEVVAFKCNRLHNIMYVDDHWNYIFPCIKEFNQQYSSVSYER
ncbi:hypothetical protein MHZ92_20505 [Sporosarcina sp. ACRSL]|uniref:hypothetical protein n=1 Tax=Sporosarcina sp. ACRSL TaxID=2918215 RepID=UPI001EF601FB|nr:hypothetical protein [Sporosarcina sp. ACRSL]MCG7346490.1 hypothetical protein [Sporosarcina sp. ACRSL]